MGYVDIPLISSQTPISVQKKNSDWNFRYRIDDVKGCTIGYGIDFEYAKKLKENRNNKNSEIRRIYERLRELEFISIESSSLLSKISLNDLKYFVQDLAFNARPGIFLLDNGNFRAVWRNSFKEQVALQFKGNSIIQYVLFRKRASSDLLAQDMGIDILPVVRTKMRDYDHILNNQ